MPKGNIRENNCSLHYSLPDIDWLAEYCQELMDAYRAYALCPREEMPICRLLLTAEECHGLCSLIIDVEESRDSSLVLYHRLARTWELSTRLLLRDRQLCKKLGCRPPHKMDGCYLRDGQLYAFLNHFRPGKEQGLRRSAWRQFIEEIPLTKQELPR